MEKIDQVKGLSKLFDFRETESDDQIIPEKDRKAYLNSVDCMAVIPNLRGVKRVMETNFDSKPRSVPKIDYTRDGNNLNRMRVDTDYLKLILEMAKKTEDDSVLIYVNQNAPITISCKEFDFIIAPRVTYEDKKDAVLNTHIMALSPLMVHLSRALKKKKVPEDKIEEVRHMITSLLV